LILYLAYPTNTIYYQQKNCTKKIWCCVVTKITKIWSYWKFWHSYF